MKRLCCFLSILFLLMTLGCADMRKPAQESTARQTAYEVVDDVGRRLTLPAKPQHIVSLTYGTDEILTELVELKRIAAYSRWAGDEEISFITKEQLQQVGQKMYINEEAIVALQPDLVVVSTAVSQQFVQSLTNAGLTVYVARSPHNYEEMRQKILGIAAVVGERERGEAVVADMDKRLQILEERLRQIPDAQRKVVIAFNFTSAMGRKGDLLDNMLKLAHVINGAVSIDTPVNTTHGQPVISKEMIVLINPDIFLLPTWNYNDKQNVQEYANQILHDPAYQYIKAVQNKQLKFVSDKYRYVASQHIVEAVENIARAVYPELF